MANVGQANIEITADDSQARSEVSGFLGFIKGAGRIATGVVAGLAAFQGISQTFQAIGTATIGANANMETYQNTLAIVLKSHEKARDTLAWAEKFAATTPFEIPQIVEATTRLSAYGLNAQKVLGDVGDMAAVMGKPLMQAVEAVADAQTGELERLREFGITKKQIIAQANKMYDEEIVNASGQITDMEKFNNALFTLMRNRYKGGMEIQSQTFKGMVSNVRDAMGTIAREMSKPVFEKLKSGLKTLVPIVSAATQAIRGDWVAVKDILGSAFDNETALKIENFFLLISAKVHQAKQWFQSFSPTVENLGTIFMNMLPIIKAVGGVIAVAFMQLASVIPPIVNGLTSVVAKFTSWQGFLPIVAGLTASFVTFKVALLGIAAGTKIMAGLRVAMMFLTNPLARALMLTQLWSKAQAFLNATILANPIVLIVSLLVGLGVALYVAYQKSETFRNAVNNLWSGIKVGWSAFLNFFTTTIPAWVESLVGWFVNLGARIKARFLQDIAQIVALWNSFKTGLMNIVMSLVNGAINIFNTLKPRIMAILQPFIAFFVNSFNNLKLLVLGIVGIFTSLLVGDFEGLRLALTAIATSIQRQIVNAFNLMKTVVLSVVRVLWSGLKASFSAGKSVLISIGNSIKNGSISAWNATKNGVVNAANALCNGAKNAWSNLKSFVSSSATTIKNNAVNGFNSAKSGVINAATGMYNSVRDWIGKIPGRFTDMKNRIISTIKGINLRQMGKDVVQGFINGLSDKLKDVKNKAKDIADAVKKATKDALKIGSPSKVFENYGNWTGEGYVIGLDGMIRSATNKAKELGIAAKEGIARAQGAFQNRSFKVGIGSNLSSVLQPSIKGLSSVLSSGTSGEVHNHYWNVNADEINEVSKLVSMVNSLRMNVRKGG